METQSSPAFEFSKIAKPVRLDLACGKTTRNGFIGVDLLNEKADIVHDLQVYPWPFATNSVDEVVCAHYVEHIPLEYVVHNGKKKDALFAFFDEVWRICRHNAVVTITCPCARNNGAFQDPTHRRFLVAESFLYFNASWREANHLDHYQTDSNFELEVTQKIDASLTSHAPSEMVQRRLNESWNVIHELTARLKVIKP